MNEHIPQADFDPNEKHADKLTVARRISVSTIFEAQRAVFFAAGCHDPEIQDTLKTIIELALHSEWQAKKEKRPAPDERFFPITAWVCEAHRRSEKLPMELSTEDQSKWKKARAKAWRERIAVLHEWQCKTQWAFVNVRPGKAKMQVCNQTQKLKPVNKVCPVITDRITDLIAKTRAKARTLRGGRGVSRDARLMRAAELELAEFRQRFGKYAPNYKEPEAATAKPEKEKREIDIEEAISRLEELAEGRGRKLAGLPAAQNWTIGERERAAERIAASFLRGASEVFGDLTESDVDSSSLCDITTSDEKADFTAADTQKGYEKVAIQNAENAKTPIKTPISSEKVMTPCHHSGDSPKAHAEAFFNALASVGETSAKIVYLSRELVDEKPKWIADEEKTLAEWRRCAGALTAKSERESISLVVRPHGGTVEARRLIQIDDCDAETLERLKPFSFSGIGTSPENYQTWLALPLGTSPEETRAVRDRLLEKLKHKASGNGGAYGAVRLSGTLNVKDKYKEKFGAYPRVRLSFVNPGRIVTVDELERAGLLAAPPPPPKPPPAEFYRSNPTGAMPAYNDHLLYGDDGKIDRSRTDAAFSAAIVGRGYSLAEAEAELRRYSEKARTRRDSYARKTVERAAAFVAANQQPARNNGYVREAIR